MCFVFISEQTDLVFTCITEKESAYFAVWTESLNTSVCASSVKG